VRGWQAPERLRKTIRISQQFGDRHWPIIEIAFSCKLVLS